MGWNFAGPRTGRGRGFEPVSRACPRAGIPSPNFCEAVPGWLSTRQRGWAETPRCWPPLGWHVLAIEREPRLFQLLRQAHDRIGDPELQNEDHASGGRFDSKPRCAAFGDFIRPAAIVLDPMYPPRRKTSALPPKGMQALRMLHADGGGDDPEGLLAAAFAASPGRVLLKRPPEAPVMVDRPVTFSVGSKLVRWDAWELGAE